MAPRKKPKIVYIDDTPEDVSPVEERAAQSELQEPEVAPSVRKPKEASRLRKPSLLLTLAFAIIAVTVCAAFIFIPIERPEEKPATLEPKPLPRMPIACLKIAPQIDWGHNADVLECQSAVLEEGQSIGDILTSRNVDYRQVLQVLDIAQKKQMPDIRLGSKYYLIYSTRLPQRPIMLVYEPNAAQFVFMNLDGPAAVHLHARTVLRRHNAKKTVVIRSTLADEMFNMESGLLLTRQLEAAIRWKVDLFHLDAGDQFVLLFKETEYEGDVHEIGDLLAVRYRIGGKDAYAFSFEDSTGRMFFDYDGRPMKSGFLMAPLEYGRISSGYNLHRPDPIKRDGSIRAHLGTDYAAPEGTPILAVGDGTVLNAENKGGNGNYVKLFHTDSIQTQYLHMSAFAEGIVPGAAVRQGQVIGYVGSTGRSTGPHVCFRYWKNGVQVDHRLETNFGGGISLQGDKLQRFFDRRDSLMLSFNDLL